MSHFKYEKPFAVEISEKELDEIAAVLSSGSGVVSDPSAFDEFLINATGFPISTVGKAISTLATLVDNKFTSEVAAYRAWLFFRVIGGFSYGNGKLVNMAWDAFAGPLSYDCAQATSEAVPAQEEDFFVTALGMSKRMYRTLRFYVRLQHIFCGMNAFNEVDNEDYESLVDSSLDIYRRMFADIGALQMPDSTGRVVTDATYEEFLQVCFRSMSGKCDLAHLCITIAAILAENAGFSFSATNNTLSLLYPGLCSQISKNKARKAFAGWLGDACLIEPSEGKTSMGNDDYFSDMDALIITSKCRSNGFDYRAAIKTCYTSASRRTHFLNEYLSLSKAVTCMRLSCGELAGLSNSQWLSHIASDSMYEDTCRFYRILKGEISEPTV